MNLEFSKKVKEEINKLSVVDTLNDVEKLQKLASLMTIYNSILQEEAFSHQSKMFDEIKESMSGMSKDDLKNMFSSIAKGMS